MPIRSWTSVDAHPVIARPLVLCGGTHLLDQVQGIAAAAGIDVDVSADRQTAGGLWRTAPLVLVVDESEPLDVGRDRRADVVLLSWDLDDADVWRRAHLWGAEHVVMLPDGRPWLMDRLVDAGRDSASGVTVAVVGGRGGSGASTLACALAMHACAGGVSTALVDGDASGGGIDLVLGAEDAEGVRWDEISLGEGRIAGDVLLEALPSRRGLRFLSCARDQRVDVGADALVAVLSSLRQGCRLVVVDVPRGDARLVAAATQEADLVLVVVPAEVRAVAAAQRLVEGCVTSRGEVRSVIRLPGAGGLDRASIEDSVGARCIGTVKEDARAARSLDEGHGPDVGRRGPWREVCDSVLSLLPLLSLPHSVVGPVPTP